jgi:hypothetical protein
MSIDGGSATFILYLIDTAIVALLTAQFLPESSAHVFNAGASVWGLDWCPIHPDDRSRKKHVLLLWDPIDVSCRARLRL